MLIASIKLCMCQVYTPVISMQDDNDSNDDKATTTTATKTNQNQQQRHQHRWGGQYRYPKFNQTYIDTCKHTYTHARTHHILLLHSVYVYTLCAGETGLFSRTHTHTHTFVRVLQSFDGFSILFVPLLLLLLLLPPSLPAIAVCFFVFLPIVNIDVFNNTYYS